jgi:SAM-dependent methyltransferase
MVATESWAPNIKRAQENLRAEGVVVVADEDQPPLPFADGTFDLVTSRHPVVAHWEEIARVLAPGGTYFSQQVGPDSGHEVYDFFLGPRPLGRGGREPEMARARAEKAGLEVVDLRTTELRMEFFDVGAMVYFLRKGHLVRPGLHRREVPRPPDGPARADPGRRAVRRLLPPLPDRGP